VFVGCFDAEIESISTGSRTIVTFLVAKGTTKSRPFLSLDTCIELGLLHLTNATHEKKREKASQASAPSTDPVVTKLTSEYHEVFSALGKHKSIKAKLIVHEEVHPIAHKQPPTTWCTNPVIAPKPHNPEAICFCCDIRVRNTAILCPVTEALTVEDSLSSKVPGSSVFWT